MKPLKIFMLVLFMSISVAPLYAIQADTTFDKKLEDKVLDRVDALINKLDNLGSWSFEVMIRQQKIDAISNILVLLIPISILVLLLILRKIGRVKDWNELGIAFLWIGIVVAVLFLAIYIGMMLPETISKLYNPEYWAIKELISTIK